MQTMTLGDASSQFGISIDRLFHALPKAEILVPQTKRYKEKVTLAGNEKVNMSTKHRILVKFDKDRHMVRRFGKFRAPIGLIKEIVTKLRKGDLERQGVNREVPAI